MRPQSPTAGTRRVLGAQRGQERCRRRADHRHPGSRCHGHHQRRRGAGAGRRLRHVQPADPQRRRGHRDPAVRQERRHTGRLGLPRPGQPAPPGRRRRCGGKRCHAAWFGDPPRGHHGAIPAHGVLVVVGDHARARRGVLRHPHLQRTRRGPPHHGIRRHARGGHPGADGRTARRGLQAVGADDRRSHGFSHRPQHQDHPRCRRGDRGDRLRPLPDRRRHRGGAPLPLASAGRWRAGHHRGGQLADGRGKPRSRLGFRWARRTLRGRHHRRPRREPHLQGAAAGDDRRRADQNPGVVVTANHCINAVPDVCAAEPGIKTYLDLPLFAGRPAPNLAAGRP